MWSVGHAVLRAHDAGAWVVQSCVCVDGKGEILMDESVYFANLSNPTASITHTGDEREVQTWILANQLIDA